MTVKRLMEDADKKKVVQDILNLLNGESVSDAKDLLKAVTYYLDKCAFLEPETLDNVE